MKTLLDWELAWGYFPEPYKYLFIDESTTQKAVAQRVIDAEGLTLKFVSDFRHLGDYLGSREELEGWV